MPNFEVYPTTGKPFTVELHHFAYNGTTLFGTPMDMHSYTELVMLSLESIAAIYLPSEAPLDWRLSEQPRCFLVYLKGYTEKPLKIYGCAFKASENVIEFYYLKVDVSQGVQETKELMEGVYVKASEVVAIIPSAPLASPIPS